MKKKSTGPKKTPEKPLPPQTLRQFLSRTYDLTAVHFHSATPFPAVIAELRKGNAGPLCELLTQTGPTLLANADVQQELVKLWFQAPDDSQAQSTLFAIGQALARVNDVGAPKIRTAIEEQHAVALSRSLKAWRNRFQTFRQKHSAVRAKNLTLMAFDDSTRIKDQKRKTLIRSKLVAWLTEQVKHNSSE